jgi:transcription-repair coupling factor (superfamily II helicase)
MLLKSLQKLSERSLSFKKIAAELESQKQVINLTGLVGSGKALLLSYLYQENPRPILVICPKPEAALKLSEDLESFLGEDKVFHFPSWEMLPYELKIPHNEIIGRRLEVLYQLGFEKNKIIVTHFRAFLEKTLPQEIFKANTINLKSGEEYDLESLIKQLNSLGFQRADLVEEVGSYSVRGGIVDIFPYSVENPARIEFFEDKIESIREFSVLSQRSVEKLAKVIILPKREVLISDEKLEEKLEKLPPVEADRIRDKIRFYHEVPGLEWMAPLLEVPQVMLTEYLPPNSWLFLDEPASLKNEYDYIQEETEKLFGEAERKGEITVPQESLWNKWKEVEEEFSRFQKITDLSIGEKKEEKIVVPMNEPESFNSNMNLLRQRLKEYHREKKKVFIFCDNVGQKDRLAELLEEEGSNVNLKVFILNEGFSFPELDLVVLTDHQIFARYFVRHRKKRFKEGIPLSSYTTLSLGDYLVHIDFGIGKYQGLEQLIVDGKKRECLLLWYQDGDKLYVPVEAFNRVQKFVGKDGEPTLSKLGGMAWEKLKAKTKKAIKDMAKELIEIYAERKTKPGFSFSQDTPWQKELEASFIYDETDDQLKAITDIKKDMEESKPMERLVCGDVGYGKTEVALRAAFKCMMDGKQVAILVPTTVLAQQHWNTFSERMREYPAKIEMLSRFKTKKEREEIIENIKAGKVDVVIGTHRLLQKDVCFKDLGLLIIDEEQRFGVAHKEALKKLKKSVDVITLTATPIPRTLQLSLLGARDMSLINTPPKERLPIQTEISLFDREVILTAILRELDRGGQVYFVHNRVQSIVSLYNFLKNLIPQAKIAIAHGQMNERSLEAVMYSFLNKRYDILLCTSIIESGLDIPSVNTIVINRADRFGLAELYQLRGRVGRSSQKAYAYLLIPPLRNLTENARKRLKALEQFSQLGSGFHLALRDLEIRGAGNILGVKQHGFIEEIGFDLYCRLLEEAVREIKGEPVKEEVPVKINLDTDIYIPEDYISDTNQRVEIYQKISKTQSTEEINEIGAEIKDRFGKIPPEVGNLLEFAEIRLLATQKLLTQIIWKKDKLRIEFSPEKEIKRKEIEDIRKNLILPLEFSVGKTLNMYIDLKTLKEEDKLIFIKKLLQNL